MNKVVLGVFVLAGILVGAESQEADVCTLDPDSGNCDALFTKYYYNRNTGQCETFMYGGCPGNDNRFDTKDACEAQCVH